MKKLLFALLFLKYSFAFSQESLTINDGGKLYYKKDLNEAVAKTYEYGAICKLVRKDDSWAQVLVKDSIYYVHISDFTSKQKKEIVIKLGMDSLDLVTKLGQPDHVSSFKSSSGDTKIYVYGKTYYHFESEKLSAINTY